MWCRYDGCDILFRTDSTTVGFAHDIVSEYFEQGLGKFSADQTKAPLGITSHEAHSTLLRTCLEVDVNAGNTSQVKSSKSLQNYASHRWFDHMEALSDEEDEHSNDKSTPDHSELVCLLYHFLVDESIVREWCYDIPLDFFTPDKAVSIATLIESMDSRMFRTFPGWFEIVARKLYCEASRSLHASRTSKCSMMPPRRLGYSPVPACRCPHQGFARWRGHT
jgi:hypothetical protein